jgi:hypothetical protein
LVGLIFNHKLNIIKIRIYGKIHNGNN